jgi:Lanthionine synthetase C-like protein
MRCAAGGRDVAATLDFLLSLWQPQSANFPAALQADAKDLVHWCHGATGAVFAFLTGYLVLGECW